METPCPYMVVENEKNVNKHEARETGVCKWEYLKWNKF